MADPLLSVSGLATGIDTQTLVEKLVSLEQRPLTRLQQQQSAYKSQVSALGDLVSKLSSLKTAASDLATNGVLGLKTTTTNTTFTATPGSNAVAGSYDVSVQNLATPAKKLMDAPGVGQTIKAGTLTLTFNGTAYQAGISDGASLADIAYAIKSSGAPVSAVVFNDDGGGHLSLTAINTGYTVGQPASSALELSFAAAPGATGDTDPAFATTQTATNALFTIDGLTFTRTSNTVTDALPGTTLQLKVGGGPAAPTETLTLENDTEATRAKLQTYVNAYNAVMQLVRKHLNVTKDSDRSSLLAGDSTVRSLQARLQALGSSKVFELGTVRTLADLGLETQTDGTLALDSATLTAAIGRDPARVNAIFADATAGVSKLTSTLSDDFAGTGTGLLVVRQSGLQDQIKTMDTQLASMQLRIDGFRQGLLDDFTAMEKVVSGYKSIGNFLTQQYASSK